MRATPLGELQMGHSVAALFACHWILAFDGRGFLCIAAASDFSSNPSASSVLHAFFVSAFAIIQRLSAKNSHMSLSVDFANWTSLLNFSSAMTYSPSRKPSREPDIWIYIPGGEGGQNQT